MKVLVIGGMHGNEPLGLEMVRLLQNRSVKNIDAIWGNEEAIAANCRFIKTDLNRSFPGNLDSDDYETHRAAELIDICQKYDVVLDFHNTSCPDNDCGFVGQAANPELFNAAGFLGINRVVVADYNCINKFATNCLSIEISLDSAVFDGEVWHQRIRKLVEISKLDEIPVASDIEKYRFVHRITLADRDSLKLEQRNLATFRVIDKKLADAMGVDSPAFPIFIADRYTPQSYGGLLNKI
jgi:hypothetical protein